MKAETKPKERRLPASASAVRTSDDQQRSGIQSLARAFALLEEVARNREGIPLADLSKRVGLHNSTAFHLLKTMTSLGYVRQIPDGKRYRIGRPLFALRQARSTRSRW